MYHSKKIGVFISHIMGYYQKNVCQGIIDKALDYGYTAEIFATMDGENLGEYGIGEESILRIPNFENYDGIIFASETYPLATLKNQILQTLKEKCTCPVVEIAVTNQSFPSVALENCSMISAITEHLITVHHYKRICYLGCACERYFSDSRENYYRDTMDKFGLAVGAKDVFICDYADDDIVKGLQFFLEEGSTPEAVICYNDRMALSFMMAAKKAGLHIPEEIAITGCDCSEDGQHVTPALTGVTFPVYELGVASVEKLLSLIKNADVPDVTQILAEPFFSASCGCANAAPCDHFFYQRAQDLRIASLEQSILTSMRMSAAFQRIINFDDGMDLLADYVHDIDGCTEFYLCLYANWDSVSSEIQELADLFEHSLVPSDEIILKLGIRNGKRLPECSFKKNANGTLLPEHIAHQSNAAYIYTPLFFENKEFGYVALSYKGNRIDYHFQLVHWFMNINQMLQNICEEKCTSMLISKLEDIYTKDALTGLYNKQGYLRCTKQLLRDTSVENATIYGFLFHLNELKDINSAYGNEAGDFCLQIIAQSLLRCTKPSDICCRFSGNDFYIISTDYTKKDAEDLLLRVQKYIKNYNSLSKKPYSISIRYGFAAMPFADCHTIGDLDALFAKTETTIASS